jgi:PAS domain S-box-containing protein
MGSDDEHGRLALEAAARAGLGVIVAQLAPPRIVYANDAAIEHLGVAPEEIATLAPLDLVAPEQRELVMARVRRRLAGEAPPPAELTIARPDGVPARWCSSWRRAGA